MTYLHSIPLVANGNVRPNRFITFVAGTPSVAVEAPDASTPVAGVSEAWKRFPPNSPSDDGFIAIAGEDLPYHGPLQRAQVLLGTAVTDMTKPLVAYTDGTYGAGAAKPASFAGGQTTGIWLAAIPERLGVAGEIIPVLVLSPTFCHPALS